MFDRFLDALAAIAEKKFPNCAALDSLKLLLKLHLAPLFEIVQVEVGKTSGTVVPLKGIYARLTDPKS